MQPFGFTKKPEASMLTQEDYLMIQELHQQGSTGATGHWRVRADNVRENDR